MGESKNKKSSKLGFSYHCWFFYHSNSQKTICFTAIFQKIISWYVCASVRNQKEK